jgi:ribosomal-protein-alanine N-acetyltransferase
MRAAPETFRTPRLIAERIGPQHADALIALNRDERVMRWIHGVASDAETREWLGEKVALWEEHGFGHWVLFAAADVDATGAVDTGARPRRFAGRAGLQHCDFDGVDEVELAYALQFECWGRGYATEAGRALLDIAFDRHGLPSVVAYARLDNERSRHVIEKLGFIYERDIEHEGEPYALYRLIRQEVPDVDFTSIGDQPVLRAR